MNIIENNNLFMLKVLFISFMHDIVRLLYTMKLKIPAFQYQQNSNIVQDMNNCNYFLTQSAHIYFHGSKKYVMD